MTIRALRDEHGVEWQVWAVHPSTPARLPAADGPAGPQLRPLLAPHLADGWLTFESAAGERRRIVPIPAGWDALDDAMLGRLLRQATPQPHAHRRRLIE